MRQRHGIKPLRYSDTVSKQALAWARMLASPRWVGRARTQPPSYWTGIRSACQVAAAGAENVASRRRRSWLGRRKALARRTARGLLGQFLRSAPHRANLLDPRATHIGVATRIRRTSGGHYYAANVVRFARASSC
ncbi:MAG: CAP domain-containing protein [Candidatus Nanopelagicales bacterium]